MNRGNIPFWLIFIGGVLLLNKPVLFFIFLIIYVLFRVIILDVLKKLLESKLSDLSGPFNKEFKDFFSKREKESVITVDGRNTSKKFSFSPSMPPISPGKAIASVIIVVLLFLFIADGFYTVPAGHAGVLFSRTGGVKEDDPKDEGFHVKIPFWEKVYYMNTRLQTYTMSANLSEADIVNNFRAQQVQSIVGKSQSEIAQFARVSGGASGGDAVDALTSDGQRVTVDLTVQFSVNKNDTPIIYKETGLNYVDKIVRPATRSVAREVITGFSSEELYALDTRERMEIAIEKKLSDNFLKNNIQLQDVLVRSIQFSDVFLNSIEEKQVEAQNTQKAKNRLERTKIEAQQKIEEAKGEAEAIRIKGESLRENPSIIQLRFIEEMAPKMQWGILPDGALPLVDLKNLQQATKN
jgi:regulator of protease activity HflC (stomatin/prohibitin superfamily)